MFLHISSVNINNDVSLLYNPGRTELSWESSHIKASFFTSLIVWKLVYFKSFFTVRKYEKVRCYIMTTRQFSNYFSVKLHAIFPLLDERNEQRRCHKFISRFLFWILKISWKCKILKSRQIWDQKYNRLDERKYE